MGQQIPCKFHGARCCFEKIFEEHSGQNPVSSQQGEILPAAWQPRLSRVPQQPTTRETNCEAQLDHSDATPW